MKETMVASMKETGLKIARARGERRKQARARPVAEYSATFCWRDREVKSSLKDVSRGGASFRLDDPSVELEENAIITLQIHTPWEVIARKGRVAWVKQVDDAPCFGVEFVELPKDAECIGLLNMDKVKIDPAWALRLPPSVALRRQLLPFAFADGVVYVACANPADA